MTKRIARTNNRLSFHRLSTRSFSSGKSRATAILDEAAISIDTKIRDLNEDELTKIRTILDQQGDIEGDLRKRIQMDIKRLMDIGCYRGLRHSERQRVEYSFGNAVPSTRRAERLNRTWM